MGLYALANAGMTPFGALLVGTIAEHLGVRAACALGGGAGLVAVAAPWPPSCSSAAAGASRGRTR